jgi:hypothetical protein
MTSASWLTVHVMGWLELANDRFCWVPVYGVPMNHKKGTLYFSFSKVLARLTWLMRMLHSWFQQRNLTWSDRDSSFKRIDIQDRLPENCLNKATESLGGMVCLRFAPFMNNQIQIFKM